MSLTSTAFLGSLASSAIKPVYLIAGAETLLVQECADALRSKLKTAGFIERVVLDADDSRFDWSELAQQGASMSLFASQRILDVRLPTGKPGKDGAQAIAEYCKAPALDTVLLISSQDWSNKHGGKWSEAVESVGQLVIAWPVRVNEMSAWLAQRLKSKGIRATPEALALLVNRVEGNLLAANQEVDKLAMQGIHGTVDFEQMQQCVADSSRFDVFKLLDACYERDSARACRILQGLRSEGEQVPALVPMIGKELLNLAYYARIQERSRNAQTQMNADKHFQAKQAQMLRMLDGADSRHFEALLAQLADVDLMSKGRLIGDAWVSLERVLVQWPNPKMRSRVSVCR